MPGISVIVPVLNDAARIGPLLDALALQDRCDEVVVVDGGSNDGTAALARNHPIEARIVVASARGRAHQLNAGATHARHDVLVFLDADTTLPPGALVLVAGAVEAGAEVGCFGLSIESDDPRLRLASFLVSARSRYLYSATGDQCVFATRAFFERAGRFPSWPLFEDMALIARARSLGARFVCVPARVGASARRWEAHGINRTILRMWALRALYHAGVSPERLARMSGREVREVREAGGEAHHAPQARAHA